MQTLFFKDEHPTEALVTDGFAVVCAQANEFAYGPSPQSSVTVPYPFVLGTFRLTWWGKPIIEVFTPVVLRVPFCTEDESYRWFKRAAQEAIEAEVHKLGFTTTPEGEGASVTPHADVKQPIDAAALALARQVITHLTDLVDVWDDRGRELVKSWEAYAGES